MTKQEMILKEVEATLIRRLFASIPEQAKAIVGDLNAIGVVIKVERETEAELLARYTMEYSKGSTNMLYHGWRIAQDMFFTQEVVAVEPLIETSVETKEAR